MKLTRIELMNKLGVGRDLSPYETCPWVHYDEEEGINCSAEVRLEGDGQEAEAELQFVYDDPPQGKTSVEQICHIMMQIKTEEKFEVVKLFIRREDKAESVYNWQEKSCNFFRACVREIKAGRIPDIDMLLERELSESGRVGDKWGDGSSKSPKINTQTLLNDMKKGQGM